MRNCRILYITLFSLYSLCMRSFINHHTPLCSSSIAEYAPRNDVIGVLNDSWNRECVCACLSVNLWVWISARNIRSWLVSVFGYLCGGVRVGVWVYVCVCACYFMRVSMDRCEENEKKITAYQSYHGQKLARQERVERLHLIENNDTERQKHRNCHHWHKIFQQKHFLRCNMYLVHKFFGPPARPAGSSLKWFEQNRYCSFWEMVQKPPKNTVFLTWIIQKIFFRKKLSSVSCPYSKEHSCQKAKKSLARFSVTFENRLIR